MSDNSRKIQASFLLKAVDPLEILKKYQNNEFPPISLSKIEVQIVKKPIQIEKPKGENCHDQTYVIDKSLSSTHCMITLGHKDFVRSNIKTRHCKWCRRSFSHDPVTLPIKMDYIPSQIVDGQREEEKKIYYGIFNFHDFSCAYKYSIEKNKGSISVQDPRFSTSTQLLLSMFSELYPEEVLTPAPDWELLDINDGPMTVDQFDSKHYKYVVSPNVVIVPSKITYERFNDN